MSIVLNLPQRQVTSKFYNPNYQDLVRAELNNLKDNISKDTQYILDLGSLDGRIGFMITDILRFKPKELYLTDYNQDFINDKIKPNILKEESFIKTQKEDVTKLTFSENRFDAVLAFGDVFNLIYEDCYGGVPGGSESSLANNFTKALFESVRVLKTNGVLLFSINPSILPNYKELLSKVNDIQIIKETRARYKYIGENGYPVYCSRDILSSRKIK